MPYHLLLLGINSVPHLMFYEYDKHYRVFTLWSQMNGRMNRYKFFDQPHKMIWLLGQKKCIICILQSAIIVGIAL